MSLIESLLIRHEGLKLKPYRDTVGKLTIGCGRNLDDVGISENEAYYLLREDISKIETILVSEYFWYSSLSENRRAVVCSMVFNVGFSRFKDFKRMILAIESGDFETASKDMLNSHWSKQVKGRAIELAEMMRAG